MKEAVESLLNQTYPYWELIAVNDGSTDNTLAILDSFKNKDERIKVFSKKNGGYATAVNLGLDKVTGDYFLMLGSDDRLEKNLFFELAQNIGESNPDMVAFRTVTYIDNKLIGIDGGTKFESPVSLFDCTINDFYKLYPDNAKILFVRDTSRCYKTAVLGNLRYFGKYGYDSDGIFSTLFTHKCCSFMSLPIDGYDWYKRANSVSASVSVEKNLDRVQNWNKFLQKIRKEKKITLADPEKRYIVMPFRICCELLEKKKWFNPIDFFRMHFSMRRAISMSKKHSIYLFEYNDILEGNPLKGIVYRFFPILWLLRHGFIKGQGV